MARPLRTAAQVDLQAAIKATAWRHIAEHGIADLSLRAIARALKITAPAIYNYFPRREDLITALIGDAYLSFGNSQLTARDSVPPEDLSGRLYAIGAAYRNWALTHPQHYQLIFGAPIPDYQPPREQLLPAGAYAMSALVSVIEAIRLAGRLRTMALPVVALEHEATFALWKAHVGAADNLTLSVAVYIWSCVHGLVSLEIAGNLPPFGPDGGALYDYALVSLNQQFVTEEQ